jgi:hypothetical protein
MKSQFLFFTFFKVVIKNLYLDPDPAITWIQFWIRRNRIRNTAARTPKSNKKVRGWPTLERYMLASSRLGIDTHSHQWSRLMPRSRQALPIWPMAWPTEQKELLKLSLKIK